MNYKIALVCILAILGLGGCATTSSALKPLDAKCSRDNANDTVTCKDDALKTLMWQDTQKISSLDWDKAKEYCENLTLAGFSDWKLPTRAELLSIVDYSKYEMAIDDAFKFTAKGHYWTSTLGAMNNSDAANVGFGHGVSFMHKKSTANAVRCVREIK